MQMQEHDRGQRQGQQTGEQKAPLLSTRHEKASLEGSGLRYNRGTRRRARRPNARALRGPLRVSRWCPIPLNAEIPQNSRLVFLFCRFRAMVVLTWTATSATRAIAIQAFGPEGSS